MRGRRRGLITSLLFKLAASRDGATPCSELGTCGGNFNALPNNAAFVYSNYVHIDADGSIDRTPLGFPGSDARLTSPGATISFTSDAHRIQAIFDYRGQKPCLPDCPRLATTTGAATKEKDDNCYRPHGATCPNQCEILVDIICAYVNLVTIAVLVLWLKLLALMKSAQLKL